MTNLETLADLPIILFKTPSNLRQWLEANHSQPGGIWLKIAKKDSGHKSVTYSEALDEALCYGWIDGQLRAYDANFYLQKFTPRRPRSVWSKNNVANIERLTVAGKMMPAGIAEVKAAKKDGRWQQAYEPASANSLPEDFVTALDKNPKAKEFFLTLNKTNRYAFSWRVQTAKKPELRAARIEKFIKMLEDEQKFH